MGIISTFCLHNLCKIMKEKIVSWWGGWIFQKNHQISLKNFQMMDRETKGSLNCYPEFIYKIISIFISNLLSFHSDSHVHLKNVCVVEKLFYSWKTSRNFIGLFKLLIWYIPCNNWYNPSTEYQATKIKVFNQTWLAFWIDAWIFSVIWIIICQLLLLCTHKGQVFEYIPKGHQWHQ